MKHSTILSLLTAAFVVGTISNASSQSIDAIAAPGETTVATLHAQGAQIYECKAANDGKPIWQFRVPIATLLLDGKTVGRHYAGPSWEYTDGSAVTGKVLASAPGATPLDIPWLKLEVATYRGTGTLAGVTTIQRLNTCGGAVSGPCEQAGSYRSAPYAADYVFLRKG